jgi:hypothetical protein
VSGRQKAEGRRQKAVGRTVVACFLLTAFCLLTSGCSQEWKKKFIRKRQKEVVAPQAILVLQPDHKAVFPPDVRYRQHYAFWKSWHGELLGSLGTIHKRDVRYMDGVISELRSMQVLLSGPPAERLKEILVELSNLQDRWERAPATSSAPVSHRSRLERLQREINKKFHYSEVKESIAPDPLGRADPSDG